MWTDIENEIWYVDSRTKNVKVQKLNVFLAWNMKYFMLNRKVSITAIVFIFWVLIMVLVKKNAFKFQEMIAVNEA